MCERLEIEDVRKTKQPLYFRFELVLNNVIGGYDYRQAHLFSFFFSFFFCGENIETNSLFYERAHIYKKVEGRV